MKSSEKQFFDIVGSVLKASRWLWALFSIREEYLASLDAYARLVPTRFANTYRLEQMRAEQALEAVREPARYTGVEFTDDAAREIVDRARTIHEQRSRRVYGNKENHPT